MTADQQKPQFEPPPWEREAFDRFHAERNASRAEEDLDSALRAIREEPAQPAGSELTNAPVIRLPEVTPAAVPDVAPTAPQPAIPEARIEAMLVQLRGEEGPTSKPNMKLIDGSMVFMIVGGTLLLVQATRLFAQTQSEGVSGAGLMFAGAVSMFIFFTGAGFLGGAYLLFRKYHR